jgi:hypothetical protein
MSCWIDSRPAFGQAATQPDAPEIRTGVNVSLVGRQLFPPDDAWNTDISKEPPDPTSDDLIAGIGLNATLHPDFGANYKGGPIGMSYVVVTAHQHKMPVRFEDKGESDPGPYPVPPDAPIEGGVESEGDRHVIVVDKDNWMLFELDRAFLAPDGKSWQAFSGAVFDLSRNSVQRRPGWTSSDAAGLPVLAGLARYDEIVEQGKLTHALRFTAVRSRRAFILPATHFASTHDDPNLPPMGMRVRLKADYDLSKFPPTARVILQGLKTYGMILADNGGNWFISGVADPRWSDDELNALRKVRGADLEVVRMGQIVTRVR